MTIEIGIKNYRCFPRSEPACFEIRPGLLALVGPNNAGKSTFLRFFYELRQLFQSLAGTADLSFNSRLISPITFFLPTEVKDTREIFCDQDNGDLELELTLAEPPKKITVRFVIPRSQSTPLNTRLEIRNDGRWEALQSGHFANGNCIRIHGLVTPTITIANAMATLASTVYIPAFRNLLPSLSNEKHYDILVGTGLVGWWQEMQSGYDKSGHATIARITQDIREIFELDLVNLVPSLDKRTLLAHIKGRSYRIDELGSGVIQLLSVLASVARGEPKILLVDEPELGLHPSLQLDFLTRLSAFADTTIFATHSLGLARASADQVYTVQSRQGRSQVRLYEQTANLAELVGSLSFEAFRDLGFDKLLLVEGTTEVRTVQQFLRQRGLDHKIVLVPLGGNSMIRGASDLELAELTRVTRNIYALIDSEKQYVTDSTPLDRRSFQEQCASLGIHCKILERRALENYLTQEAVQRVKGDKYRALAPYERLSDRQPSWSKSENWKIAQAMKVEDLRGTDLGEFLDKLQET